MKEIELIRKHPLYLSSCKRLEELERDRRFCRHQMPHLLDVARIAYIRSLENGLGLKKEVIYAAAILHDIGKASQYTEGIPHETAGKETAEKILEDTDTFTGEERQMILQAILEHRRDSENQSVLGRLLYESDKLSRACYACPAEKECNWSSGKKNMEIKW